MPEKGKGRSYTQLSRLEWVVDKDAPVTQEVLLAGSLMRMAQAMENVSQALGLVYHHLRLDRAARQRLIRQLIAEVKALRTK